MIMVAVYLEGSPGDVFRIVLQKLQKTANAKMAVRWELVDRLTVVS